MTQITEEQMAAVKQMAAGIKPQRTPVLKNPGDYGMEYEDTFFPALDGVPLEAWFIPAEGSDRLILCNHPMTMNRWGFPGHLDPWRQFNPVTVDFIGAYKALHEAGYNVITYDLRNCGRSGAAHGGVFSVGLDEWRDVIGAMNYVKSQDKLKNMAVGLLNPCAGGNSAMVAMTKHPEYFEDVKAFVCPQPASMHIGMHEIAKLQGLGDFMEELDLEQVKLGGYPNQAMSAHHYAANVKVPMFITQVKEDMWSRTDEDVQVTYDLLTLPEEDKKLFWIEGTTQRFDGYNYFSEHPEMMIGWFDKYMK